MSWNYYSLPHANQIIFDIAEWNRPHSHNIAKLLYLHQLLSGERSSRSSWIVSTATLHRPVWWLKQCHHWHDPLLSPSLVNKIPRYGTSNIRVRLLPDESIPTISIHGENHGFIWKLFVFLPAALNLDVKNSRMCQRTCLEVTNS